MSRKITGYLLDRLHSFFFLSIFYSKPTYDTYIPDYLITFPLQ